MRKLENKVAVVTGGNSGIGLAIAQMFARNGAKLAIFGRDRNTLDAAQKSLDGSCLAVQGDVRHLGEVESLYQAVKERFGAIDIVVANAGGATVQPFVDVDEAAFDRQSDINFKGTFFTIQKAVPVMNDGGSVIIVSSNTNAMAVPGMSVYGAAKAAVRALARTLTLELAPRRIRVNVLTPGPIETPAFTRTGLSDEEVAAMKAEQETLIPLGRIGLPDEIAAVALFLASEDASFIAGAEIAADGGMAQV